MTDQERLAEVEADIPSETPITDLQWVIDYARRLTAERDALLVDRDAWKARCLG